MHKIKPKILAIILVIVMITLNVSPYAYASDTIYTYDSELFVAMDEDGNLTYTPVDEVETMPLEQVEAIDNIEYEVVVGIGDDEVVVSTKSTESEAVQEIEVIEEIIDNQMQLEETVQEIANVTENEEILEVSKNIETTTNTKTSIYSSYLSVNSVVLSVTDTQIDVEADDKADDKVVDEADDKVVDEADDKVVDEADDNAVDEADDIAVDEADIAVDYNEVVNEIDYGVLIISGYVTYENEDGVLVTGNGSSAPDAAYLGIADDGTYIFKQAAATGYISSEYSYVIDYDTFVENGYILSVYTTSNGKLYHKITTNNETYASTQIVGYQQDYMEDETSYYSYDGIYFYQDYKLMIDDYKAGVSDNAINATEPYYNYYQYLSYRSQSSFTAEQIDEYLEYKLGSSSTSVLLGTGQDFIDNQEIYGANALLMLGTAINESAWGTSSIANNKNNIFGHGAYDTDTFNAFTYDTVSDSIAYHANSIISMGYSNPKDWRYYGACLGDKNTGTNVKYASDPYWGEKAAAQVYAIEEYFSDDTYDYDTYQIGVTSSEVIAYDEPGGEQVYNTLSGVGKVVENLSVLILSETEYDGETWYKIQSDAVLTEDRTTIDTTTGVYDFDNNYVYMKASEIILVNNTDIENEEPSYMLGDPSGDGAISAIDYMMIKNHIMGTSILADTNFLAADVNKDEAISAIDYMMIKNHIMGTAYIE
ncbi:MAG: dockerin type I domain-containing protein [Clostridia bacterium]